MASLHDGLSVDDGDWPVSGVCKGDFGTLKTGDALSLRFLATGSVGGLHARSSVGIKLGTESRTDRAGAPGANKARIVETHDDDNTVPHNPLIDSSYRQLSRWAGIVHCRKSRVKL